MCQGGVGGSPFFLTKSHYLKNLSPHKSNFHHISTPRIDFWGLIKFFLEIFFMSGYPPKLKKGSKSTFYLKLLDKSIKVCYNSNIG